MARRVVGRPAAAWWRPRQLLGIARFGSGRLPAARWRDRNAYRRQDGTWQKYENGGWTNTDRQPADRPQPTGEATNRTTGERTPTDRSTVDQLDRDSTARTKGAERTRDYGNYRSGSGTSGTGSYRGGGASRGGGGRRR